MKTYNIKGLSEFKYPVTIFFRKVVEYAPTIARTIYELVEKDHTSISLVFSGTSGAVIATHIAKHLQCKDLNTYCIHIKKKTESTHRSRIVGCYKQNSDTFSVFADDFIYSGSTLKHCAKVWYEEAQNHIDAVFATGYGAAHYLNIKNPGVIPVNGEFHMPVKSFITSGRTHAEAMTLKFPNKMYRVTPSPFTIN